MPTVKELGDKRLKLFADARKIIDTADAEKRSLKTEEQTQYDAIMKDADKLHDEMKLVHGTEERRKKLDDEEARAREALPRQSEDDDPAARRHTGAPRELRYRDRLGRERVHQFADADRRATQEYNEACARYFKSGDKSEARALQVDSGTAGGFLIPTQMAAGILRVADDMVFMRSLAAIETLASAASLGIPTQESNPADAEWTGELTAATLDTANSYGNRELKPHNLVKAIDLSRRLVRMRPTIVPHVTDRLGYKFAVTMEKGYLTGNGANQPLGVFTASPNGISTARDVATDNTSTAMTAQGLMNAYYALKAPYRTKKTTRWGFHRDGIKQIRGLKDSVGGYLLRPGQGIESNDGDKLLGVSIMESEYIPNTFTTGLYVGIIGDFSYYQIADSLEMEVQVVDQTKAAQNLIQYIGRAESDGMPMFEEAFARVKLG